MTKLNKTEKEYIKKFKEWENEMTINELNYCNVVNDLRELINELEPNKKQYWYCECGNSTRLLNGGDFCDVCMK